MLSRIEHRVLWLSAAMVHAANSGTRKDPDGLKVGGHQASCASMVSIMTVLWFHHLRPQDRVSVKPHASPAFHAIKYLLGELDRSYLTRLREFGGFSPTPAARRTPTVRTTRPVRSVSAPRPPCGEHSHADM